MAAAGGRRPGPARAGARRQRVRAAGAAAVSRPALDWLYSLADQERGVGWNPRASPAEQWRLGRTRALLDLAGAPDRRLRIALVAGTKGKGSTAVMLASMLGAAGARCGLYTKPHLQSYRERIRVDGAAISPAAFDAAVARMRELVPRLPEDAGEPTTFEVTTALALDEFARQECGLAVVEVGLGGRLDATNATEPALSVITSISYDHTAILGRTLGEIATEKAGILRGGRPALIARQRPAAAVALRRACEQRGARCISIDPALAHGRHLALAGAHQQQNAALAIAAARELAQVDEAAIDRGLARVTWPGRFELVAREPAVVLDGAHNGASATALAATLIDVAAGRPIDLVIGINRDKDARAVLRPLAPLAARMWPTRTIDNPRALAPSELAQLGRRLGATVQPVAELSDALRQAQAAAVSSGGLVCVTGSLMLVGQARAVLGLPMPERLW